MFNKKISELTVMQWLIIVFVIGPVLSAVIALGMRYCAERKKKKEQETVVKATT